MTRDEEQPRRRRPRPGPSVYDDRGPAPRQEGRRIAEIDRDGRLQWADDWVERASGWQPLDEFLRGKGRVR